MTTPTPDPPYPGFRLPDDFGPSRVDRLTAENEQLRAKVDQYAKSWQIIDTENNDLRARVQAVRDLCRQPVIYVPDLLAAIGDGDDRG